MALVLISSLSRGSLLKGLIAALLGMLTSMPGLDPSSGVNRLTFGSVQMTAGFEILPVILGIFAISQLLADTINIEDEDTDHVRANMKGIPGLRAGLRGPRLEYDSLGAHRHRDRHLARRRRHHRLDRGLHHGAASLEAP
jgi:hypothetical protein